MTNQSQAQSLLDELGLSTLSDDKKEQLLIKMTEVLLKRIFVETMDRLNEKDVEEYEKMIDASAGPEEVENFLRSRINDYDAMLEKVAKNFREEMLKSGVN